jgi:hypothetical protein
VKDPAREPAPARAPQEGRRRPQTLGDTFKALVEELSKSQGALAEVLSARGRLTELGGGRAVLRLENLRDSERRGVGSKRSLAAVARALTSLTGEEVTVNVDDVAGAPPADDFTRSVADLFGGRIEDAR